ncbi:MAG: cytochrome c [Ignavibacteria bacterium]|nr:cytochrome c [Ignavibacteria bacterium]
MQKLNLFNTPGNGCESFLKATFTFMMISFILAIFPGCSEETSPDFTVVKDLNIGAFNQALADKGKSAFSIKCVACHKYDTRLVGPPLRGITKKRTPEYIVSMIMYPEQMQEKNDTIIALVKTYLTKMTNQNVNQNEALAIYEHLRDISGSK